jgi:DUF971 family protein
MSIKRFIINNSNASLTVIFDDIAQKHNAEVALRFEYLRVFAPTNEKGQATGLTPKVYHKKQVQLLNIESVAKHGYRLTFDDGHRDIYSHDYLAILAREYQTRWQHYLQSANTASNSREAMIDIKEVK